MDEMKTGCENVAVKKKVPKRECIGCRELKDKKELLRIVRTPEGAFVLDTTGKKNGRGAYLCRSQECLAKAVKTRGLERSFHGGIDAEVYEELKKEFEQIEQA